MSQAATEIRLLISGRPGGVNAFLRRWGKLAVDYATALIPDRAEPFERMVEDILVDAISQARAVSGARSDAEVRAYMIESALRTVRARYRDQLATPAQPERAAAQLTVDEVVARTRLSPEEVTQGISEGRIRAVRADNTMRVAVADIPALADARHALPWHLSAAERELLCLHYRMGRSAEQIARIAGASTAHYEGLIHAAALRVAEAADPAQSAEPEDAELLRYLARQLPREDIAALERRLVGDRRLQQRLETLRARHDTIRRMFDSPACDLSTVAIRVRARNPHQPVAVPPAAALWVQVAGIAALMILLHRVGAWIAPPDVRLESTEGAALVDETRSVPAGTRVVVGQSVTTGPGGQALLNIDGASRVRLAGESRLTLREPRPDSRQVMQLDRGEVFGRFVSSGHAFTMFAATEPAVSIHGDAACEFDFAVGLQAAAVLPDNLHHEQCAAFAAAFEETPQGLRATRAMRTFAGHRVGTDDAGLAAGDLLLALDQAALPDVATLRAALMALPEDESAVLRVRRAESDVELPLKRASAPAVAVIRVFRGTLTVTAAGAAPEIVNRGQWALVSPGEPMLIGNRGLEDFRLLRMDAAERFKDRLHWLNTESFPLRAENSLLEVDRRLRAMASQLEGQRAREIAREGAAEIARFEEIIQGTINAARDRIARGDAQPREIVAGSLSDLELVAAEGDILGAIAHWRRQATSGAWPTLGAAAKTLHERIQRDRDAMNALDADMTRALELKRGIAQLEEAMAARDEEIARHRSNALYDADGSRRRELDQQVESLQATVRAGVEATRRIELLRLRLNDLDRRIDDLRRTLPTVNGELASAQLALREVDAALSANPYTPAALAQAEARARAAAEESATAAAALTIADKALQDAESAAAMARTAASRTEQEAAAPRAAAERARDVLTDALADRVAAQSALKEKQEEVDRLRAALDALPPDDPARPDAEAALAAVRKAAQEAQTAVDDAQKRADTANDALQAASNKADEADAKARQAAQAQAQAEAARAAARGARDAAYKSLTEKEAASREAESDRAAMLKAKAEREALDARRVQTVARLQQAEAAKRKLDADIDALEAEAKPQRETLAQETRLVEAADKARAEITDTRRRRDQHQAVDDAITLAQRDLDTLRAERDQTADSNLVKNYDAMVEEYRHLSARADAIEFLRARALLEDQNFALAQRAAQDRYRETAEAVTREAVALLDTACLPYAGFALAETPEDAAQVRAKLLEALWRLYFEPGVDGADDAGAMCYYVAVQSGAGPDSLRALDDRWKLALAQVFDKAKYEAASRLRVTDLAAPAAN